MKIGFISLPVVGHLNPMTALARKLQLRGHEVVFIGVPDVEPFARAGGLNFASYCEDEYPTGSIAKLFGPVSKLNGLETARWSVREGSINLFSAASKHLPRKLAENGVEALVVDAIHTFIELVPMSLGLPYAQVWNALPMDLSGTTPPCFFSWPHESAPEARSRNLAGVKAIGEIFAPVVPPAMAYAEKMGLKIDWDDFSATTSKQAVITQTPKEFDFPGIPWPEQFHYTGPFHDYEGRASITFPWEKLDRSPLVYASLGTLVNGLEQVYKTILEATKRLSGIQVVLSIGDNVELEDLGAIPSNAIVVRTAPQIDLLRRAALCITHAGLNTALESLGQGVPMAAIPIGYDQPGVAARIAHHGVGEYLELDKLAVERVTELIQRVLENHKYREKARWFQTVIGRTRGLDLAVDVIDRSFK